MSRSSFAVFMRYSCAYGILLLVVVATGRAQDAHSDLEFDYVDGRIRLDERTPAVWTSTFATSGLSQQFTSAPGFASEIDEQRGIGPNDQIVYNVLDRLLYWDGSQLAVPTAGTLIRIANVPSTTVPDTLVSGASAAQFGEFDPPMNRIGSANSEGDFHAHLTFELDARDEFGETMLPAVGAYGLKLSLSTDATAVDDSPSLLVVFNFGLAESTFQAGVEALAGEAFFARPSDLNRDGAVDAADAGIMFGNWSGSGAGDLNIDGTVDAADAGILFAHWTGDSAFALIPEPMVLTECSWVLLLIVGAMHRRRRGMLS